MEETQSRYAPRYGREFKENAVTLVESGKEVKGGGPGFGHFALVAEKLVQAGESWQRANAGWHDGWGKLLAAGNPAIATGERLSASAEGDFKKKPWD